MANRARGEKYPIGSHWFLKNGVGNIPANAEVIITNKNNKKKDEKEVSDISGQNIVWTSVKNFRKKPR